MNIIIEDVTFRFIFNGKIIIASIYVNDPDEDDTYTIYIKSEDDTYNSKLYTDSSGFTEDKHLDDIELFVIEFLFDKRNQTIIKEF